MSTLEAIHSDAAPAAIGPYSQAIRAGNTVWLSGQIPLDPATMAIVSGGIETQTRQVFENITAVAAAAGGSLAQMVKINISLTDLADFGRVNEIMASYFAQPYPARACVQVAALPKGSLVEIEAIMVLDS